MFRFLAIFGGAPALSRTRVFPKKVTPNGHSPANFRILNVSDFLAGVTRGNFCAERIRVCPNETTPPMRRQFGLHPPLSCQHFLLVNVKLTFPWRWNVNK
jgi:hypothetical protein